MTSHSELIFRASYADFNTVKGRKVLQIILELPIEEGNAALAALGGVPRFDQPVWVGVARLDTSAITEKPKPLPKPHKNWDDMSYSQQSGVLCNDDDFRRFVQESHNSYSPVDFVRSFCEVVSRSELDTPGAAATKWEILVEEYRNWQRIW